MRKIIFTSALFIFYSCKKYEPHTKQKNQTNHMEATVTYTSGNLITLNETGDHVTLGSSSYGNSYSIVTNNQNQRVSIYTLGEPRCYFYPNYNGSISPTEEIYYVNDSIPGDTVNYTISNDIHKEANFNFTCIKAPGDTVRVAGSFKGEFVD
ncbi:MAG: hypothetical protein ABI402_05340 [Ferruginibacter sp.]